MKYHTTKSIMHVGIHHSIHAMFIMIDCWYFL